MDKNRLTNRFKFSILLLNNNKRINMQFIKFEDQWYNVNDIKRIELANSGTMFRIWMKDGTVKRLGKPKAYDGQDIFITK